MRCRKIFLSAVMVCTTICLAACGNSQSDKESSSVQDLNKLEEIHVIAREDGSGTRSAFAGLVGFEGDGQDDAKSDLTRDDATIVNSADEVIEMVQADATAEVMYVLSDIERIGTLCGSISDNIRNTDEHEYSEDAMKDLKNSIALIKVMYVEIMEVMTEGKRDILKGIQDKKAEILGLDGNMRKAHMARVASGKCSAGFTTAFTNVLNDIDRMGNSCVNIADALSGAVDMNYFEYLDS